MNRISVFYEHICSAATQRQLEVEKVLEQAKAWGIDLMEISFDDDFVNKIKQTKKMFDNTGVGASCICANFDFTHDSFVRSAEKYKRVFDAANHFECKTVLCVPGFFDAIQDRDEAMKLVSMQLEKMCDEADKSDITVVIEDFDGVDSPCCRTEQMKYHFDNVERLGCAFDTGNFRFCLEEQSDSYEIFKDRIVHVHCKDRIFENDRVMCTGAQNDLAGNPMYTVPVCDGAIGVDKTIKRLINDGYKGAFVIEHFGMADQFAAIEKSAGNILRIIKNS